MGWSSVSFIGKRAPQLTLRTIYALTLSEVAFVNQNSQNIKPVQKRVHESRNKPTVSRARLFVANGRIVGATLE